MWLGGISCQSVWGMIFQWVSTLKVSIELPVISRHRRDMTERLLKATLSPNQTNCQNWCCLPSEKRGLLEKERMCSLSKGSNLNGKNLLPNKESALKGKNLHPKGAFGSKFFPFKAEPFPEEGWYAGKKTGSHKSCPPCKMVENPLYYFPLTGTYKNPKILNTWFHTVLPDFFYLFASQSTWWDGK